MTKRLISFVLLIGFTSTFAVAQYSQGIVHEGLTMKSDILGQDVSYTVYLPSDYETSQRYYPVVYLLPDGGVSWYINDYQGKVRWEDMFVDEFIPAIETNYRIRKKKEFRGIAGLSMGGYGSLVMAMRHPDLFAATAAFSSGVVTDEEMQRTPQDLYDSWFGILYGEGLEGSARLTDHWRQYSVLDIVKDTPVEQLKQVRYYIDCGDADFFAIGNSTLHILLRQQQIPHEYRVRNGGHGWKYWRTGLPDGLRFIGESFHR